MAKKVYLKDIANKLQISQNTVSLALRGMPGIKKSTREKVLQTAKELGYSRTNSSEMNTIFLVTTMDNSTDSYFYSYLQQTIEDELSKSGYKLVVTHFTNDSLSDIMQIPKLLKQIEPKGVLILGEISESICLELLKSGLPTVCIGFYYPNIPVDAVIEDNIGGMNSALNYMYNRGYRSFGFIGDIHGYISIWERWISFVGFFTENNLKYDSDLCIINEAQKNICNADWLISHIKLMPSLPDAFICANDQIAANMIKALHTLGYNIPGDIGILGYDNSEIANLTIPSLTTIDTFRTLQGLVTIKIILDKIKNDDKTIKRVVLPVKLIEGLSTIDLTAKEPPLANI
ncbi:MAG: LacI family DNA-binding transcriptional regulator [Eubacteriales bacterium]|nr:LacI family DNA-binding transcriptional regulator [Eubacteriales bacterium]